MKKELVSQKSQSLSSNKKRRNDMTKRCLHKKLTYEDKFARKYYCSHARLGTLRYEKKHQKKLMRRIYKKEISEGLEDMRNKV